MISALLLSTAMLFSMQITGVNSYQGEDMTDEEFAIYAEKNIEVLQKTANFAWEHKELFATGVIGGTVGIALKDFIKLHPTAGAILASGAVELVKGLFKEATNVHKAKDERREELDETIADLRNDLKILRDDVEFYQRIQAERHEEELEREHKWKEQRAREEERIGFLKAWAGAGGDQGAKHIYERARVEQARDAGPYREGYREHAGVGKEGRDLIEGIYRESMQPKDNRDWVSTEQSERSDFLAGVGGFWLNPNDFE